MSKKTKKKTFIWPLLIKTVMFIRNVLKEDNQTKILILVWLNGIVWQDFIVHCLKKKPMRELVEEKCGVTKSEARYSTPSHVPTLFMPAALALEIILPHTKLIPRNCSLTDKSVCSRTWEQEKEKKNWKHVSPTVKY